jgi:hypothetical protein
MTHVYFDQNSVNWGTYFKNNQIGTGIEIATPKVFRGMKYVRGYGSVKNMLGSIGRFLMPIASNIMESAKREAVSTLGNISQDIAEGRRPIGETLREQGTTGLKRIGEKLQQCGKGKKKKKKPVDYLDFN